MKFIKAGVCRGAHIKRVIESFMWPTIQMATGKADGGWGKQCGRSGGETAILGHNLSSGTFNTFCSALLSTQIRLQNPVRWSSPWGRGRGRRCGTGSGSHC